MEQLPKHLCRACRTRSPGFVGTRSFSVSSSRRIVPPESPAYVDVPEVYQGKQPYRPRVKGILPVPRDLFPCQRPDKGSAQYFADTTADQLEKNRVPDDQLSAVGRRKRRDAATRKDQLRSSLMELHARQQSEQQAMEARSSKKQQDRAALLVQAEREDEQLTASSIPRQMLPEYNKTIEALEFEVRAAKAQHATKVENVQRHQAAREREQMNDLHTLYMNARTFVTTMPQMDALIAEQFDTSATNKDPTRQGPFHADFSTDVKVGESMWNFGPPDSIKDMIADATNRPRAGDQLSRLNGRNTNSVLDAITRRSERQSIGQAARSNKEQDRLKRIAEKLSGGKI